MLHQKEPRDRTPGTIGLGLQFMCYLLPPSLHIPLILLSPLPLNCFPDFLKHLLHMTPHIFFLTLTLAILSHQPLLTFLPLELQLYRTLIVLTIAPLRCTYNCRSWNSDAMMLSDLLTPLIYDLCRKIGWFVITFIIFRLLVSLAWIVPSCILVDCSTAVLFFI